MTFQSISGILRSNCAAAERCRPRASVLLAIVMLSLSVAACGQRSQAGHGAASPVPVTAAQVVQKTMPLSFKAIGNVEAIETVSVKARIGGELLKIGFREGDEVTRGEVLFVIDPRPYKAALEQAQAALERDQALLAKAQADVTRYADLVKQDYVTKEQYDQIKADAASLEAAVAGDNAAVETARLNLDYCTISSPVTGRTGNLDVKMGNLIKANADQAMVTINQMQPIYVSFSVPAQLLPSVLAHRSQGIQVQAVIPDENAAPALGKLIFVDNAVDTTTSTILLKATFANKDERLWPGQFVDLTVILGEEPDRLVCPAPAIQTGQEGQHVFVVKSDKTVELRPVKVARMNEHDAVIASGLEAGETVVTDGQLRLVDGSSVEIKNSAPAGGETS